MSETLAARPYTEHSLQIAPNMQMYYRDYGPHDTDTLPVIFIPGYFRTCKDFEEISVHIARNRRVLSPDMRGRGRTDRSDNVDDYTFERMIEDVRLLLQTNGISRAIFGGTALGVHLTWVIAQTDPDLVAAMIINDTGTEPASVKTNTRALHYAGSDELTFDEALARIQEQNSSEFPHFGEEEWLRMTRRAYCTTEHGTWVRDFDQRTNQIFPALADKHPNFWPEYLAMAGVPMALLRGEHSDHLSKELADRMTNANPAAKTYVISGSGHAPTLWEPDAWAAVDDFLGRLAL